MRDKYNRFLEILVLVAKMIISLITHRPMVTIAKIVRVLLVLNGYR